MKDKTSISQMQWMDKGSTMISCSKLYHIIYDITKVCCGASRATFLTIKNGF